MRIGELLELTKTEPLNQIAKERLTIGEKPAREALKAVGCYSKSGNRGWFYDGDSSVLEQSIYDYAKVSTVRKAKANVPTNKLKVTKSTNNQGSKVEEITTKEEVQQGMEQVAPTIEVISPILETNVMRKRSSFDLDVQLLKQLKIQAIIHDRTVYEMVESAIKLYLTELKKY